jgi:hypothetical protein
MTAQSSNHNHDGTDRAVSESFAGLIDAALRHAAAVEAASLRVEYNGGSEGVSVLVATRDYAAEGFDKRTQRKRRALGRLLERIASHAGTIEGPSVEPQHDDLVRALSEGRAYTPAESAVLELENQKRGFEDRRNLVNGALTSSQVGALLGTSLHAARDRAHSGTLIAIAEYGRLLFPPWQFDPDGPDGVVPGLAVVLKSLNITPTAKVRWLTRTNPILDGRAPIDVLKAGDVQRVLAAARSVGAS